MILESSQPIAKDQASSHQIGFLNLTSRSSLKNTKPKSAMKPEISRLLVHQNNSENQSVFDLLREAPLAGLVRINV